MKAPRTVCALSSLVLGVAACVASDSTTGVRAGESVELAVQPALIPSAANGTAQPINRIRAVTTRVSDGAVIDVAVQDVSPGAASWELVLSFRAPEEETVVVVFLYLINVAGDGTESVQFSGRSDPITVSPGSQTRPDVPIVRGPVSNLLVTGVTITSATGMVVGGTQVLAATATTSEAAAQPQVFWTSLDPTIVGVSESTATALAVGTARVVASAGSFADTASIVVRGPLTITTASLADAVAGTPYSASLAATGGDGSYTWSLASGSLPAGLSLNPTTGQISGTPDTVGSSTMTVRVASGDGQTATRQLAIAVYAVLSVTTSSLPAAATGSPYTATLAASGGNGSYAWTLLGGSLPPGLSLSAAGSITGTPTTAGGYSFTVGVASGDGQSAQRLLSITVAEGDLGQVRGIVVDAVTSELIASASVSLAGGNVSLDTSTDANGAYSFLAVPSGGYVVSAVADAYVENTADITVASGPDVVRVDFALPPVGSIQRFAGLSGRVTNAQGNPLAGAAVGISGGAQTNGFFKSTTTDADGTYALVGIVMDDALGEPILQFTVLATASGYKAAQAVVPLSQNETIANVDFELSTSEGVEVFFSDGFEQGLSWEAGGFWNRSTLVGVVNEAYPDYVDLAPGDNSAGALPAPAQGTYALWYGQPSTGNFIGTQIDSDLAGSGGTSSAPNQGAIVSPSFLIPPGAPTATLSFDTWFEIESVNPNASGYDIMTVSVFDVEANELIELGRLNPFVDPTFQPRETIPFTSGGFNAVPVWRPAFLDLSSFVGKTVSVVFTFDTVDTLFNGFRGWLIDDVSVTDEALPFGAPAMTQPASDPEPRTPRAR